MNTQKLYKCTCRMVFTSEESRDAHISFYKKKHDDRGATYPCKHRLYKSTAQVAVEREAAKRLKRHLFLEGS